MPREKSTKHCPRCDQTLPVSAFDPRPRINGRSNGYRPHCRACSRSHGDSLANQRTRESIPEPNPSGLCLCGCGQRTKLAAQSSASAGNVKGKPLRYIRGHANTKDACRPENYTVDPETGCWNWNGSRTDGGYGVVGHRGRTAIAHRVYYERYKGTIPAGCEIDHLCRNRACCNPEHLEAVTRKVNLRRGNGTILDPDKVREIRRLWRTGKYTRPEIAKRFGIASTTVQMVVYRHSWKDVE